MLTLTASVRELPPDNAGGYDLAVDEIVTQAPDYGAAVDQVSRLVPEGWQLLSFRVDRDPEPPVDQP